MGMTLYDFNYEFEELMDKALNDLSSQDFAHFLNNISIKIDDYEVKDGDNNNKF